MTGLGDFFDAIDSVNYFDRAERFGTCQGKTIFGKRCRIRAVVRPDGTAFCAKHAIETVEGE